MFSLLLSRCVESTLQTLTDTATIIQMTTGAYVIRVTVTIALFIMRQLMGILVEVNQYSLFAYVGLSVVVHRNGLRSVWTLVCRPHAREGRICTSAYDYYY